MKPCGIDCWGPSGPFTPHCTAEQKERPNRGFVLPLLLGTVPRGVWGNAAHNPWFKRVLLPTNSAGGTQHGLIDSAAATPLHVHYNKRNLGFPDRMHCPNNLRSGVYLFFYQIGQFRECQVPQWAKFKTKYRFRQSQGVHTGFSSWLGPHVFPLRLVLSC